MVVVLVEPVLAFVSLPHIGQCTSKAPITTLGYTGRTD